MHIIPLNQARPHELHLVGGKAASLGELLRHGIPAPSGFVITTEAFRTFDQQPLTPEFEYSVLEAFDGLAATLVAVRSSGVAEDSSDASWAGQFESYLNVPRDGLLTRIQDCWASSRSKRAAQYAGHVGQGHHPLAVIVQHMVDATVSGVLFTANPVTRSRDEVMIEAVHGLGEDLVQGAITPDNYLIAKATAELLEQDLTSDTPILSARQLQELTRTSRLLEDHYQLPLDIEWTYDGDQLFILQARPITTL